MFFRSIIIDLEGVPKKIQKAPLKYCMFFFAKRIYHRILTFYSVCGVSYGSNRFFLFSVSFEMLISSTFHKIFKSCKMLM